MIREALRALALAPFLAALVAHPARAGEPPQASPRGDWIGQIDFGGEWQRVNLHLEGGAEGWKGTLDLPQQGRFDLPLAKVSLDPPAVRIEWQGRAGLGTFDGQLREGSLSGEFEQGEARGTFQLVRVARAVPDLALAGQVAGTYRLGPDRFVDLAPFSEDEDRPIFFDSQTRRTGVLYATGDGEFFSGPSYGVMFPVDVLVSFTKNERGEVAGLRWQESGSRPMTAEKVSPYRQEEIAFRNGAVTLRGTLTMPAAKGPHPVVILVHGSGPQRRPGGHWTHFFTRHGVGYFNFDKRGAGESGGDLNSASMDDLAGDVLAAVQALRANRNVDPRRVGLIGHSNGGWVAPLAASRSSDIAFLIVKSGSGLPIHENILYELEMDMRGAGRFSADDIAAARALRKRLNESLLTNTGWESLMAAIERSKEEPWFEYARVQWLPHVPPPLDSATNPFLSGLRRQIDFDPAATWERVRCPVLVLLGELDANAPSAVSAALIERGLQKGANRDYTIRVLPKANHGLFESRTGFSSESPRLQRYVPGYLDGIAEWLRQRLHYSR